METATETTPETVVEAGPEVKAEVKQPKKKTEDKLFPVKLLKNYRPISQAAQIKDEKTGEGRPLNDEESQKVRAGQHIALPVAEAKDVIAKKIAERDDEIA